MYFFRPLLTRINMLIWVWNFHDNPSIHYIQVIMHKKAYCIAVSFLIGVDIGAHQLYCVARDQSRYAPSQRETSLRWSVPLFKCLTVLEFSFILFDLCLLITFFNFIMNYVPIATFWIFTYHKIRILSIMFCFIWSYWIIYFLACLEVSWRVVS